MIRRVCVCVCVCVCVLRNVRYNKATVLRESVAYIRQLQEDNRRLSATEMDHARLLHVNWTLSRRLKVPLCLPVHDNATLDSRLRPPPSRALSR